jgi:hypothetical protein
MITNYLSPLEFQIIIQRLPNMEFFTQKVTLPGISASPIEMPGPLRRVYQTSDRINYEEFSVSFIVDEKMTNYLEIFNWIKGISSVENYNTISKSEDGAFSDISVILLNSMKNASMEWTFYNCFPTSISGIDLDTTNTDVIYPESIANFRYDYYDIKNIST